MDRRVSNRNILDIFCEDVCSIVEKHTPYVIVSGFVAIALGRLRGTEDIDMIIPRLNKKVFVALHGELYQKGFECVQSNNADKVFEYLQENASVRYVRLHSFVPEMEIKFAKDELDRYALASKTKIPQTQIDIYFSEPELNIAVKEELLTSQKDLEDARHTRLVLDVNEEKIAEYKKLIHRWRL